MYKTPSSQHTHTHRDRQEHTLADIIISRTSLNNEAWKGFTEVHKLLNLTSTDVGDVGQKDETLIAMTKKRGRPGSIQGSALDCPRGGDSSWAFTLVPQHAFPISKHWPHEVVSLNLLENQVCIFPLHDWTVLETREWRVCWLWFNVFLLSSSMTKYQIHILCFLLYGELSFLVFRFLESTRKHKDP